MDDRIFLNNDVSKIVNITPRQVLSWTDKGLIVPFREAGGAGTKRGYNYINLLEFLLCDVLFMKGVGIQKIKNLLNELRISRSMEQWARNFKDYYENIFEQNKEAFQVAINSEVDAEKRKELTELYNKAFSKLSLPDENIGILLICFMKESDEVFIVPMDMCNALNLVSVKEMFIKSIAVDVVDMGKIKTHVDGKIQNI
jgi:DNA-binding transcriptional MerR regulator